MKLSRGQRAPQEQEESLSTSSIEDVSKLPVAALSTRGIAHTIAEKYSVRVEFDEATGADARYYFPLFKQGQLVGYQRKTAKGPGERGKSDVDRVGETKGCDPFGSHISGSRGNFILVTEGAEDALAASQLLAAVGKNYRVVATLGTDGWKRQLQFFNEFDKVVICYDADEGGQKAAREFSAALRPGQGFIMDLDSAVGSDPNAYLVANAERQFWDALNRASSVRPDGVIALADKYETCIQQDDEKESVPYPWKALNALTYGMRKGELVTWTAGSGIGKSALVREVEVHLLKTTKDNIGTLALEESVKRHMWGLMGIVADRPLHLLEERKTLSEADRRKLFNKVFGGNRMFAYDHWGSTAVDNLISKIRYMIVGLNCEWIVLDHLSIVVSSQEENGDERKAIDSCMTKLRGLCSETGAGIHLVSHLRRIGDSGHEEGHAVSLAHLRGSQSIAQLSDIVIAAERNQQHPDPLIANTTNLRVLKNRYAGLTGVAGAVRYDRATGRLNETEPVNYDMPKKPDDSAPAM